MVSGRVSVMSAKARAQSPPSQTHSRMSSDPRIKKNTHTPITVTPDPSMMTLSLQRWKNKHAGHLDWKQDAHNDEAWSIIWVLGFSMSWVPAENQQGEFIRGKETITTQRITAFFIFPLKFKNADITLFVLSLASSKFSSSCSAPETFHLHCWRTKLPSPLMLPASSGAAVLTFNTLF